MARKGAEPPAFGATGETFLSKTATGIWQSQKIFLPFWLCQNSMNIYYYLKKNPLKIFDFKSGSASTILERNENRCFAYANGNCMVV